MAVGDQRSEESRADRVSSFPERLHPLTPCSRRTWPGARRMWGHRKAELDGLSLFVLAILAGAFIAFGAIFATTVGAGSLTIEGSAGQVLLTARFRMALHAW